MQTGHPWEVYEHRRRAERAMIRRQAAGILPLGAVLGTGIELVLLGAAMRVIPTGFILPVIGSRSAVIALAAPVNVGWAKA